MIEISHIKNYQQDLGEGNLLVETDSDYVKACQELRVTLSETKPLKIYVRQKWHFDWLRNFTGHTNIHCTFSKKNPRTILAEKWNATIPEWLDDETVTEQDLLELSMDTDTPARFEEKILAFFLGTTFYADKLDDSNLTEIVFCLNSPEMPEKLKQYPVLKRCLQEKVKTWDKQSSKSWVKTICPELLNNAEGLWKDLTLLSILSGYPKKLLEYVLPVDRIFLLKSIPSGTLEDLSLNRVSIEQASNQIEMFFKGVGPSVKSKNDFSKILKCASGRLPKEFRLISELLASNIFEVTKEDISAVQKKFKSCPGISSGSLAALNRYVKPRRPDLAKEDASWDNDQWVKWVVDEYIPYRHWQTLNSQYDHELELTVQLFSDWYLNTYTSIHQDNEKSLVHVLSDWGDHLRKDDLSLVYLIDSMPLTYWRLFQDAMSRAGFHRHKLDHRFTPLPSHTEVVKPLMLSGSWKGYDKGYEVILKKRSEKDWNGKKVVYLSNLKSLSRLDLPQEPCVILLNFLASDEILHSDVELKDTTYEEELYRLFARLADSAKNLYEKWSGTSGSFSVYAVTDHGASKILDEEKKSFDSKVVSKIFADEKHRFSCLDKEEAEKIPQNLWEFGYRFSQPFINEDLIYFIPRGHNTVKRQITEKGYVHGGATPEEVVVPVGIFRPVKPVWKALGARFLNLKIDNETGKASFYIQRIISLQIEIQNPNAEAVHIHQVEILSPDADVKSCKMPHIETNQYGIIHLDCYFNKSALGNEELAVLLTYKISGTESTKDITLPAEFKSAVTGGFSLRDLK